MCISGHTVQGGCAAAVAAALRSRALQCRSAGCGPDKVPLLFGIYLCGRPALSRRQPGRIGRRWAPWLVEQAACASGAARRQLACTVVAALLPLLQHLHSCELLGRSAVDGRQGMTCVDPMLW